MKPTAILRRLYRLCAVGLTVATISAIAPRAAGQELRYSNAQATSYTAGTNKVMALTTNAFFPIDVPPSAEAIMISVDYKFLNAPGAGDATSLRMDLFRGIDSGRYESNIWQSITIPGNSTTAVSTNFSLTVGAVAYLRGRLCNLSTNAHGTNVLVEYGFKFSRR